MERNPAPPSNGQNSDRRNRSRIRIPINLNRNMQTGMVIHHMIPINSSSPNIELSIIPSAANPNGQRIPRIVIPLLSSSVTTLRRTNELVPYEDLFSQSLDSKLKNQFYDLGVSFYKQKEYHLALKNFKLAYEKDNKSIFLANIALCYKKVDAWNEALVEIKKAFKMDPKDSYYRFAGHLLFNLAKISNDFNEILQSLEYFREAFDLNKSWKNKMNYLQLRKIIFLRKNKDRVEEQNELIEYLTSNLNVRRKNKTKKIEKRNEILFSTNSFLKEINLNKIKKNSLPKCCNDVISLEPFKIPVVTPSGNSFEKSHLEEHCRTSGFFDPISRKKFQKLEQLYSNKNLEKMILSLYLKNQWFFENDQKFDKNISGWKFANLV